MYFFALYRIPLLLDSIDVPEIRVLTICQIIKRVHKVIVPRFPNTSRSDFIFLPILTREMKAQKDDHDNKKDVAADMGAECYQIPRRIPSQEHLRTDGVTSAPATALTSNRKGVAFGSTSRLTTRRNSV